MTEIIKRRTHNDKNRQHIYSYSTSNALHTASCALLKNIRLKHTTSSGGTLPKSTAELIGNSTFSATESKHTCKVFTKFSTFDTVPLIRYHKLQLMNLLFVIIMYISFQHPENLDIE